MAEYEFPFQRFPLVDVLTQQPYSFHTNDIPSVNLILDQNQYTNIDLDQMVYDSSQDCINVLGSDDRNGDNFQSFYNKLFDAIPKTVYSLTYVQFQV